MLTTLAVTLLVGTSALQTPARPLGRRAAIGTAAAASFLPVAAAFAAAADEAALITEIKEIKAKLDGAAALHMPCPDARPCTCPRAGSCARPAACRFCSELTVAVCHC